MKHLLAILLSVICATAYSQTEKFNVIATCQRDMQTQTYGKVQPVNIVIEKTGNSSININGTNYNVVSVDKPEDTNSINSRQYTVNDAAGKEYIIVFSDDIYNKVDLMKHQVIIFNTAHPYDWTYYFVEKEAENN